LSKEKAANEDRRLLLFAQRQNCPHELLRNLSRQTCVVVLEDTPSESDRFAITRQVSLAVRADGDMISERILNGLVDDGFLYRTRDGAYLRVTVY
jgi:hypothetical protein